MTTKCVTFAHIWQANPHLISGRSVLSSIAELTAFAFGTYPGKQERGEIVLRESSMPRVDRRSARPWMVWGTVLAVACALVTPPAAADLGTARLQIAGTTLVLSPASQSVPLDTPTLVSAVTA